MNDLHLTNQQKIDNLNLIRDYLYNTVMNIQKDFSIQFNKEHPIYNQLEQVLIDLKSLTFYK